MPFHLLPPKCWNLDRQADAKKSLRWLRGAHYDIDKELSQLIATAEAQNAENTKFTEIFRWWAAKPLLVAIGLMMSQQLSGINAVLFFTADIFTAAGSELDPAISTVIVNCVNVRHYWSIIPIVIIKKIVLIN